MTAYTSDHLLEMLRELTDPATTEERKDELERILTDALAGEREPGCDD